MVDRWLWLDYMKSDQENCVSKGPDALSAEGTKEKNPNGGAKSIKEGEVDESAAQGGAKTAREEVSGVETDDIGVFKNQRRKEEKED